SKTIRLTLCSLPAYAGRHGGEAVWLHMPPVPADRPVAAAEMSKRGLLNERLLGFIQVFLKVLHEGCATCPHSRGVTCVGLMLAVNVAVGVADMDLAKLCEEINAGDIGSPEIGVTEFPITNIAGEQRAAEIIGGLFQDFYERPVARRHVVAHFL